jgi:hypothetical protein
LCIFFVNFVSKFKLEAMIRTLLSVVTSLVLVSEAFAQTITSSGGGSGAWSDPLSWSPNTVPTSANSLSVTISSGHTITLTDTRSIDQLTVNGTLIVNSGNTLTIDNAAGTPDASISSTGVLTNNGTFTINSGTAFNNCIFSITGTFNNSGTVNFGNATSRISFNANSLYDHQFTTSNGAIPRNPFSATAVSWNATSTCRISGYTTNSTPPTGLNQTFGNFTWNTPNLNAGGSFFDFNGQLSDVNGTLTINSIGIGGDVIYLGISNTYTLNIDGNFIVNDGLVGFINDGGAIANINVLGDFELNGGFIIMSTDLGTVNLDVNGTFDLAGGDIDFSFGGSVELSLSGDLNLNSSSINVSSGTVNLTFDGASQDVTGSTVVVGALNYEVINGTTVNLGTSSLTGDGNFLLSAGGTIQVASPQGLVIGTTQGNIRNAGTRTYTANSNIVYSGSNQNLGSEWSSSGDLNGVAVNLELINGTVVNNTNIGTTSLVGELELTNGRLNIGNSNTLTIQGVFTSTASGFVGGSTTSSLMFGGSGSLSALNFATGSENLSSLTMGRSGTLVLGTNLTVANSIALTGGNLDISGRTLTFNGTAISSAGTGLISSSTSNLIIGGSTYSGAIPFSGAGNQINNLTLSTTGGAYSLNSSLTIVGTLFLTSGTLNHISGLTMGTGSTISRAGGAMTGIAPGATTSYNVSYTGSGTTGIELPSAASRLNNLNIDASGTITLDKNIIVNGSVNLFSGSLASSSFNMTLAGSSRSWNQTFGGFTPGTGSVTVTGSYTIVGISPVFGNLTVNSGATLTMVLGTISPPDPGNVFITGDFTVNAGSTFNANNGTVYFSGSAVQNFSGGGKMFNNITIDKSGGSVSLGSAVNLVGVLDIETSTTLTTNSHLTLISNSSGTASIASIPTGGAVSGDVTVQRFVPGTGRDFRDISTPVFENGARPTVAQIIASGVTITGNFTGSSFPCGGCATNNASFFFYDESVAGAQTLGYSAYPPNGGNSSTSILSRGRGYSLLYRNELGATTLSLTAPINTGNISLPVSFSSTAGGASEDGWNLVGNPYPSQIDWDAPGWTKTAIQGNQISVWDPNKGASGGYRVWNGSTGDLVNGQIALGQGFWVKATNGTVALSLTEAVKNSVATSFYRTENKIEFLEVSLLNTDSGDEDNLFIQLSEEAQSAFDPTDGIKKMNPSTNFYSVLSSDERLSINSLQELPVNGKIHLGLSDVSVGVHRLSIHVKGSEFLSTPVYLFDKHLGLSVDMKKGEYLFEITESNIQQSNNRFYLFFSDSPSNQANSFGIQLFPVPVESELTVLVSDENIAPEIQVIDQMQRLVGSMVLKEERGSRVGKLDVSGFAPGVYFARGSNAGKPVVVKFIKH